MKLRPKEDDQQCETRGQGRLKDQQNKKKGPADYNKLGLFVIALVVVLFLGSMLRGSIKLEDRLASYDARAESLKERLNSEKERTKEIDALKEYMKTDEYTEEVAREKLGLVKAGEIVFQEGTTETE